MTSRAREGLTARQLTGDPDGEAQVQHHDVTRRLRRRPAPEPREPARRGRRWRCTSGRSRRRPSGRRTAWREANQDSTTIARPRGTPTSAPRSWGATCSAPCAGRGATSDWRGWWGDDPPFHTPVFVLTHHPREPLELEGGTTFTFVTDGIEAALERALEAADGRDVAIGGGADTGAAVPARAADRRARDARRPGPARQRARACSTTSTAAPPATSASASCQLARGRPLHVRAQRPIGLTATSQPLQRAAASCRPFRRQARGRDHFVRRVADPELRRRAAPSVASQDSNAPITWFDVTRLPLRRRRRSRSALVVGQRCAAEQAGEASEQPLHVRGIRERDVDLDHHALPARSALRSTRRPITLVPSSILLDRLGRDAAAAQPEEAEADGQRGRRPVTTRRTSGLRLARPDGHASRRPESRPPGAGRSDVQAMGTHATGGRGEVSSLGLHTGLRMLPSSLLLLVET